MLNCLQGFVRAAWFRRRPLVEDRPTPKPLGRWLGHGLLILLGNFIAIPMAQANCADTIVSLDYATLTMRLLLASFPAKRISLGDGATLRTTSGPSHHPNVRV
jgi:hypothetical protein